MVSFFAPDRETKSQSKAKSRIAEGVAAAIGYATGKLKDDPLAATRVSTSLTGVQIIASSNSDDLAKNVREVAANASAATENAVKEIEAKTNASVKRAEAAIKLIAAGVDPKDVTEFLHS